MKNISMVLAVVILLGFGIAVAQDNGEQNMTRQRASGYMRGAGQRAIMSQNSQSNQSSVTSQVPSASIPTPGVIKSETCDGTGRGYGDGSKPQPRDGTGFGAKAQKRQGRNAKTVNGQGKGLGKGAQNGNPQRARRQLRDGSCSGQNSSNTAPITSENK